MRKGKKAVRIFHEWGKKDGRMWGKGETFWGSRVYKPQDGESWGNKGWKCSRVQQLRDSRKWSSCGQREDQQVFLNKYRGSVKVGYLAEEIWFRCRHVWIRYRMDRNNVFQLFYLFKFVHSWLQFRFAFFFSEVSVNTFCLFHIYVWKVRFPSTQLVKFWTSTFFAKFKVKSPLSMSFKLRLKKFGFKINWTYLHCVVFF